MSEVESGTRQDEALAQALEERNRLWAQLQEREAQYAELEHWRRRVADIEGSLAWRITKPLRLLKRALSEPVTALQVLTRWVQDRRER